MQVEKALEHIASIEPAVVERYVRYLKHIAPESTEEYFRRWLFSYASVHTSWKLNCQMYQQLEGLQWLHDKEALHRRIVDSRAGFHNRRTDYIHEFSEFFWQHPDWFRKSKHEGWQEYRKRLQEAAMGIGRAKSSFVIELTHYDASQVICTDTHVLQLYGFTAKQINGGGIAEKAADKIEDHWTTCCRAHNVPPVVARWIYWDRKQGHADSRYWSFVLEKENYNVRLAKLASAA